MLLELFGGPGDQLGPRVPKRCSKSSGFGLDWRSFWVTFACFWSSFFQRFFGCLSEGAFLTFVAQRPPNGVVLEVILVTFSGPGGNVKTVISVESELNVEG